MVQLSLCLSTYHAKKTQKMYWGVEVQLHVYPVPAVYQAGWAQSRSGRGGKEITFLSLLGIESLVTILTGLPQFPPISYLADHISSTQHTEASLSVPKWTVPQVRHWVTVGQHEMKLHKGTNVT
jgi:hypothetical protein